MNWIWIQPTKMSQNFQSLKALKLAKWQRKFFKFLHCDLWSITAWTNYVMGTKQVLGNQPNFPKTSFGSISTKLLLHCQGASLLATIKWSIILRWRGTNRKRLWDEEERGLIYVQCTLVKSGTGLEVSITFRDSKSSTMSRFTSPAQCGNFTWYWF